ncbi:MULTISPECIES: hypothetical protein [Mycolicibacterium]|uniref:hypothetical protein n=1 Tax=Mycolicibacterium TaxID=1866885 RepID=UPI0011AE2B42|nr:MULTISPECIES: hypothetical protein [Mycolicibacterium]WND55589.1 hypothetical protein QQA43_23110 [Mycolicibacterium vanbaalenii]
MTAPEPWREEEPPPLPALRRPADPNRLARDKTQAETETEFGWGSGLVPPHLNGRPPSEGGVYRPKAPPVELVEGSPIPREQRRPRGEVRGHPGEQIAR